jgi:hypothetical protein
VLRKADSTAAGIDANKMLESLKQFFEEVVGNPRKVNENLVEGFGDGIKDFFSSDKIIGNIQKGFKDWVSKKYPGLEKIGTFGIDFSVQGMTSYVVDVAGVSLSDIKDLIYSTVNDRVLKTKGSCSSRLNTRSPTDSYANTSRICRNHSSASWGSDACSIHV